MTRPNEQQLLYTAGLQCLLKCACVLTDNLKTGQCREHAYVHHKTKVAADSHSDTTSETADEARLCP